MDLRYVEFAHAEPFFYERIDRARSRRRSEPYRPHDTVDWGRWEQATDNGWQHLRPPGLEIPDQGWKIHVSATLDNAATILGRVSGYCGRHRIAFKFRPTRADLLRINLKYADRASSGKFITVYPVDEAACEQILTDLDALVTGSEGPYILSDLRWNTGPLYLRYGAFRPMQVRDADDRPVAAIRRPDGELEPDRRTPAFTPPDWLPLPAFVQSARDLLQTDEPFGYRVIEALHFSNGGGVYRAEQLSDGAVVVLKEARPHAGLGPDGRTATERLEREREQIERLRDVPSMVDALGHFERHGHQFLVLEYIRGRSLNQELAARHPLVRADATQRSRDEYRDWALGILGQVEAGLREIHARGQVHGDLHPGNVIVTPDGTVRFVDLEMSHPQDGPQHPPGGAPGFMPVDGRTGIQADRYALACLTIALFIPLTLMLPLDPRKASRLADEAVRKFRLDPGLFRDALVHLDRPEPGPPVHVRRARDLVDAWPISSAEGVRSLETAINRGIWETLDLSRADRVFPGDIRQFTQEALSIAHGACGVLLAAPHERCDEVLDWVVDRLDSASRPGFFDGLTGIAHTMRHFGRHELADQLYADVARLPFDRLPGDLYGGLAGIGLDLIDEDPGGDAIQAIRTVLRERAPAEKAGLLHGASGTAWFWLRSYETFSEAGDLELARRALAVDLAVCVERPDGSVQLNDGTRTLPYLGSGSIGVALVAMRLLGHVDDPDLHETVRKIIHLTRSSFTVQPGLFNGRAGFVLFLAAVQNSPFAGGPSRVDLVKHTRDLGLYALVHGTGLHFPGEQMLRASVDWASGSAGVLTALRAYSGVMHGVTVPAPPLLGLLPTERRLDLRTTDRHGTELLT